MDSFEEIMKPAIFISWFLGAFSLNSKFRISIIATVWSIISLSIYIFLTIEVIKILPGQGNSTDCVMNILFTTLVGLIPFIHLLQCIRKSSDLYFCYIAFSQAEILFSKIGHSLIYNRGKVITQRVLILFLFISVNVLSASDLIFGTLDYRKHFLLFPLFVYEIVIELQFYVFVLTIEMLMNTCNNVIKSHRTKADVRLSVQVYHNICKAADKLNSVYSLQILFIHFTLFNKFVVACLKLAPHATNMLLGQFDRVSFVWNSFKTFYFFSRFFLCAKYCASTSEMVRTVLIY